MLLVESKKRYRCEATFQAQRLTDCSTASLNPISYVGPKKSCAWRAEQTGSMSRLLAGHLNCGGSPPSHNAANAGGKAEKGDILAGSSRWRAKKLLTKVRTKAH